MTHRERVMAALRFEPADRVPHALWRHFYRHEWDPEALAAAHHRWWEVHRWDLVKFNPRATYFAEAWGGVYERGGGETDRPVCHRTALPDASFGTVEPLEPDAGVFGEHLQALGILREQLPPEVPVVHTVFSPLTVAGYLVGQDMATVLEAARRRPAELEHALEAIASTLARYAQHALTAGAEGIFFAISGYAATGAMTREEYERFGEPWDMRVLAAGAGAPCNVLHLCGDGVYFDLAARYDVAAVNWAPGGRNPTVSLAREQLGGARALLGGVHQSLFQSATPDHVHETARQAVGEAGGVGLILGPGCSISPASLEENVLAFGELARLAPSMILEES